MLGILLEPRLDSPITIKNKDEWDYVLRKCFVTEAQSIGVALKNLAFGAEGLIDRIESETEQGGKFLGNRVRGEKIVRDLTVEDWARVVDVFDKWAFKPDVSCLFLGPTFLSTDLHEDSHSEIDQPGRRQKLECRTETGLTIRISSWTLNPLMMRSDQLGRIRPKGLGINRGQYPVRSDRRLFHRIMIHATSGRLAYTANTVYDNIHTYLNEKRRNTHAHCSQSVVQPNQNIAKIA